MCIWTDQPSLLPQRNHLALYIIFAPVRERVLEAMGRLHVPGVAIGVLYDGKEYTAGFGIANVTYPAPVMAQTLFQIGSITKTITAVTVMRLVEAGRWNWTHRRVATSLTSPSQMSRSPRVSRCAIC